MDLIPLKLDAAPQNRKDCWIDMNGNDVKDIAEDDIAFGYFKSYPILSNQVIIYGKKTLLYAPYEAHLENINTGKNPYLEELDCSANNLTNLNMSSNTQLKVLKCNNNGLKTLDLNHNIELKTIEFGGKFSDLEYLDLSNNKKLKTVTAQWSRHCVKSINLANGNTDKLEQVNLYKCKKIDMYTSR